MSEITLTFQNGKTIVVPFAPDSGLALTIGPLIRGEPGPGLELTIVTSQEEFDSAVSTGPLHWIVRV